MLIIIVFLNISNILLNNSIIDYFKLSIWPNEFYSIKVSSGRAKLGRWYKYSPTSTGMSAILKINNLSSNTPLILIYIDFGIIGRKRSFAMSKISPQTSWTITIWLKTIFLSRFAKTNHRIYLPAKNDVPNHEKNLQLAESNNDLLDHEYNDSNYIE